MEEFQQKQLELQYEFQENFQKNVYKDTGRIYKRNFKSKTKRFLYKHQEEILEESRKKIIHFFLRNRYRNPGEISV